MFGKFSVIKGENKFDFKIKRKRRKFVVIYNDNEYVQAEEGTPVSFNGDNKIVTKDINFVETPDFKILIVDKGRGNFLKIYAENGMKAKNYIFIKYLICGGIGFVIGLAISLVFILSI